jgi:hypothetical protein
MTVGSHREIDTRESARRQRESVTAREVGVNMTTVVEERALKRPTHQGVRLSDD